MPNLSIFLRPKFRRSAQWSYCQRALSQTNEDYPTGPRKEESSAIDRQKEEEEGAEEDEEQENGLAELTDEELALGADIENELKTLLEEREGEGIQVEGGIPWRFAEDDELEVEEDEEEDTQPGDGCDGGGIVLGGAPWASQVLALAEGVLRDPKHISASLSLFAFRVYPERQIVRIRLDKLTDKFGSPSIDELESFLADLYALVQSAEAREDLPQDIEIEVSTPGAERVLQVPQDLTRFAHSPMYVCYNDPVEGRVRHEVYELVGVDQPGEAVIWKVADVRLNRELLGKGRRLNKKQREGRIRTAFQDINVVRMYLDV